jgi:CheY-like chemotaxis protein
MLSHELRNPLSVIGNAVQLLQRRQSTDPQLGWMREVAKRQVHHLTRIAEDLLDVTRIARGKFTLQKHPVELAAVVARAVETVRPLINSKRQELRVVLPQRVLRVEGDLIRLTQVLGNLLGNAAKFSDEGGLLELLVEEEPAGERPAQAVIRVKDKGIGIPSDMLGAIFDLYAQAASPMSRPEAGLGIGLALARGLIDLHGGTIQAFSEGAGRGSEFVVRLPLIGDQALLPQKPAPTAAAAEPPRLRLLVVDDNVDGAETLALLLRASGHEVQVAHAGDTALTLALEFKPDAVLSDIALPGLSGYELARRLREHPDCRAAALIAVSGFGRDSDRDRSRAAGFDHHLVKPLDYDSLHELLVGLCSNGRSGRD